MISLATSRLLLRPWVQTDLAPFIALCSDAAVMRFIGDGEPVAKYQANKRFDELSQEWQQVGYGLLAIERLSDHRFLGFAGLGTPDVLPQLLPATEIGWRIRSDSWGAGYGTEAAAAVADWAFSDLGRQNVLAIIREDNEPSIRIAEKLNMVLSQTIADGRYARSLKVYELEAATWRASGEN